MAEGQSTHVHIARYQVSDQASGALGKLAQSLKLIGERSEGAREHVRGFGKEALVAGLGVVGLGVGLHELAAKVIEANREFERAQKKMTGTLFAALKWDKAATPVEKVTRSMRVSGEAMEGVEKIVTRFAVPLTDVQEGYDQLALSLGRAGVTAEELPKYLTLTTAAAKVAGTSVGDATNILAKFVLTGRIREGSGEIGKMVAGLGKLSKATPEKRLEALAKRLKELPAAADVMSQGFDAALFRLRENFDRITRVVTGPVFNLVTQQLESWAESLGKVNEEGRTSLEVYADKLVAAFETLKDWSEEIKSSWADISDSAKPFFKPIANLAGDVFEMATGHKEKAAARSAARLSKRGPELETQVERYTKSTEFLHEYRATPGAREALTSSLRAQGLSQKGAETEATRLYVEATYRQEDAIRGLTAVLKDTTGELTAKGLAGVRQDVTALGPGQEVLGKSWAWWQTSGLHAIDAMQQQVQPKAEGHTALAKTGAPQINIHNMNITQDFKEQDPDRVFVAFTQDLERHVTAPITSNQGGPATR